MVIYNDIIIIYYTLLLYFIYVYIKNIYNIVGSISLENTDSHTK